MLKHDDFNRYIELYSEYVSRSVDLHNYHQLFVRNKSFESSERVREQFREMADLCITLKRACLAASKECVINAKIQKQLDKEAAIAYKKANPLKRGRPKKEKKK